LSYSASVIGISMSQQHLFNFGKQNFVADIVTWDDVHGYKMK